MSDKNHFRTFNPQDLSDFLANLNLEGLKIAAIESPCYIYSARKVEAISGGDTDTLAIESITTETDTPIILTLSDGRKIDIGFSGASDVSICQLSSDYKITDEEIEYRHTSISNLFSNIVGKKISTFKVYSTDNVHDLDDHFRYGGFDENQGEFITKFSLIFSDESQLSFECDIDFMVTKYNR